MNALFPLLALVVSSLGHSEGNLKPMPIGPREIVFHTESRPDGTYWLPEKIEVVQGESIKFVVKHEVKPGQKAAKDTHGFLFLNLR